MTEKEKKIITAMRSAGMSYSEISETARISRDSVAYFCQKNGMGGNSSGNKTEPIEGRYCLNCLKPIEQTEGRRKRLYCSDKCRMEYWGKRRGEKKKRGVKQVKLICSHCGKSFYSYAGANRKYCSTKCYMADRYKKEIGDGSKAV